MDIKRFFVQQIKFDGSSYTKGTPIDTYAQFNVICSDTPMKLYPEAKDVVAKDWPGRDGQAVYIPQVARIKDFDWEVTFLYCGVHANMRTQINSFVSYLYGKTTPVDSLSARSARLVVYDQYDSIGYKDARVVSVDFGTWWDSPTLDNDAIAEFKVKFHIYDPVTAITPTYNNNILTDLSWT